MLSIHILQGPDTGAVFPLPEDEPQLIGRSSEALPCSDPTMSRRQAELTPDQGHWFVRDLDSANGTQVNGQLITTRMQLKPGDQIRCGSTLMVLLDRDPAAAHVSTSGNVKIIEPVDEVFKQPREQLDVPRRQDHTLMIRSDDEPHALEHLRLLYRLASLTATCLDQDNLLQQAIQLVKEEFEPTRIYVVLSDGDTSSDLPIIARGGSRPGDDLSAQVELSIRMAIGDRDMVHCVDASKDSRLQTSDGERDVMQGSLACVPITSGDRLFGALYMDVEPGPRRYEEADARLLRALGQHLGLAIYNIELVSSAVRRERLAAVGETVATLSHSIKNILQGLRGGFDAIEIALNQKDLEMAAEGWPILSRNLDRIMQLTMNMLAYSKPRTLELEPASLPMIIQDVVDLLMGPCRRKKVRLDVRVDPDVPPIQVDVQAIHQALVNLVTNAIEAVEPETGLITIRSEYLPDEDFMRVEVMDNGPGISSEDRLRIFEPFVSTKGQRGTGLGLAVTRGIIQQHGGSIELSSGTQPGATMVITLPGSRSQADSGDTHLPHLPTGDRGPG